MNLYEPELKSGAPEFMIVRNVTERIICMLGKRQINVYHRYFLYLRRTTTA